MTISWIFSCQLNLSIRFSTWCSNLKPLYEPICIRTYSASQRKKNPASLVFVKVWIFITQTAQLNFWTLSVQNLQNVSFHDLWFYYDPVSSNPVAYIITLSFHLMRDWSGLPSSRVVLFCKCLFKYAASISTLSKTPNLSFLLPNVVLTALLLHCWCTPESYHFSCAWKKLLPFKNIVCLHCTLTY
jgi:hypothetical protein